MKALNSAYFCGLLLLVSLMSVQALAREVNPNTVFKSGPARIDLVSEDNYLEVQVYVETPSFNIVISPIPTLNLLTASVTTPNGGTFELRISPDSAASISDLRVLPDDVRMTYQKVQDEVASLVGMLAGDESVEPFLGVLEAIRDGRGVLTFTRERKVLEVNRQRDFATLNADEVIEASLNGRTARLEPFLPPGDRAWLGKKGFSLSYINASGSSTRFLFPFRTLGEIAYVETEEGRIGAEETARVASEFSGFLKDLMPALLVASSANEKIEGVYKILSRKAYVLDTTKEFRQVNKLDLGTKESSSKSNAILQETTASNDKREVAPGYAIRVERTPRFKRIYYYRSDAVNGLIIVQRQPSVMKLAVTANKKHFDPYPLSSESIPFPDIYFKYLLPLDGVSTVGKVEVADALRLSDMAEEDVWLYKEARNVIEEALLGNLREVVFPPEVSSCLQVFVDKPGLPQGDENLRTLLSVSLRESYGAQSQLAFTYDDPEYHYQIVVQPRRSFPSYAFGHGQGISPPMYRFFLAESGRNVQLVIAYPERTPIGKGYFEFLSSSRNLSRLYELSLYFSKYEPDLKDVQAEIGRVWSARERVRPKVFMKPLPGPPYTDWLDVDSLP